MKSFWVLFNLLLLYHIEFSFIGIQFCGISSWIIITGSLRILGIFPRQLNGIISRTPHVWVPGNFTSQGNYTFLIIYMREPYFANPYYNGWKVKRIPHRSPTKHVAYNHKHKLRCWEGLNQTHALSRADAIYESTDQHSA